MWQNTKNFILQTHYMCGSYTKSGISEGGFEMFRRVKNEKGASAVEYGVMVALIATAIVATVGLLGSQLNTVFQGVVTTLGG